MPGRPDLAAMIDHTLLRPDATETDIRSLCQEARRFAFSSVCVNPVWISLCKQLLEGSKVKVGTVVGFPLGALPAPIKAYEAAQAMADGADELDMVLNLGFLRSGRIMEVEEDIRQVVQAAGGRTVKVIIEAALLTDEEKVAACELAQRAGAHFVKTSTGFSKGGATVADVQLMRRVVGPALGVKAAGGIRTREAALELIAAGATRIGTSAGVAMMDGDSGEDDGPGR